VQQRQEGGKAGREGRAGQGRQAGRQGGLAGRADTAGRLVDTLIFGFIYVVFVAFRTLFVTMVTTKNYEGHIVIIITVPNDYLRRKAFRYFCANYGNRKNNYFPEVFSLLKHF
jgi:hypothetical protein